VADANLLFAAEDGLEKLQFQVKAQVIPAYRPLAAAAVANSPSRKVGEEALEKVGEATDSGEILEPAGGSRRTAQPSFPKAVVASPQLVVREHLIGAVDFLEAILSPWLFVDVRVILAGQPTIGALNLFLGAITANPQDFVVVTSHRSASENKDRMTPETQLAGWPRQCPSAMPQS
jgi:hypothetical protein